MRRKVIKLGVHTSKRYLKISEVVWPHQLQSTKGTMNSNPYNQEAVAFIDEEYNALHNFPNVEGYDDLFSILQPQVRWH